MWIIVDVSLLVILYMFGIMSSRFCEVVNVVVSVLFCRVLCSVLVVLFLFCILMMLGMVLKMFGRFWFDYLLVSLVMVDDGVIG